MKYLDTIPVNGLITELKRRGIDYKLEKRDLSGEPLMEEVKCHKTPVCEMTPYYEPENESVRLYVIKDKENQSFWCSALQWVRGSESGDAWGPDSIVEVWFESTSYFDGVRHLHLNYINYPNMPYLLKMLSIVREIEKEVCMEECIDKDL